MRLIDADKIIFREIDEIGGEYEPYLGCSKSQIDSLPSVTPQLSVPEVTALAEWIEKLTKECEEAYNKGYADGMKAQEPILDKIRAEIETKYGQCDICEYDSDYCGWNQVGDIADILQIIDKYKA